MSGPFGTFDQYARSGEGGRHFLLRSVLPIRSRGYHNFFPPVLSASPALLLLILYKDYFFAESNPFAVR